MERRYTHWRDVPADDWKWPHFSAREIACPHCGAVLLVPEAMDKLEAVRLIYGKPIRLASAYRCPEHEIEAAKTDGPGSHSRGCAFDPYPVGVNGDLAAMEDAFFKVGVLGRGKGNKRGTLHIHFDWDEVAGRRSWGY